MKLTLAMLQTFCPIKQCASLSPHLGAVLSEDDSISYKRLDALVHTRCSFLKGASTDPYPFLATPSVESLVTLFALFRLGRLAYPRNVRFPPSALKTDLSLGCEQGLAALLLDTSGSSGPPKQAALTLNNLLTSAEGAIHTLQLAAGDRYLLSLPLWHVGGIGIAMRTFLAGSTLVLSKFPLDQAVQQHRITHLSCVPTQLYRLLQETRIEVDSLKAILLGGAPIGRSLFEAGIERGLPLMPTYGMTEMSSLVTCSRGPSLS